MNSFLRGAAGVACALLLAACATQAPLRDSIVSNPYVNYLAGAGYIPLVMPSNLQSAGALVLIDSSGQPIVKGDLKSCGMSDADLYGSDQSKADQYRNGKFPNFSGTGENDFGLGITAALKGFSGAVGATTIHKVTVEATDVGQETLNAIRVKSFLSDPNKLATLDPVCRNEIESGHVAIVTQAAYIQGGKISVYGKDNFTAKLDKPAVIQALQLTPSANLNIAEDGTLSFSSRMYVAIRVAYRRQPPHGGPLLSHRKVRWVEVASSFNRPRR